MDFAHRDWSPLLWLFRAQQQLSPYLKKTIRSLVSGGSRRLFRHGLASNTVRPGTDEYDEADDHDEETKACVYGAESETAVVSRLGQQIAERGSERPRQDVGEPERQNCIGADIVGDLKSTRLNSSHQIISYADFCLIKK